HTIPPSLPDALPICTAYATTLTIGDSRDLGLISPNHPADPTDSEGFIDILLAQPSPSGPTVIGANIYTRTANDPLGGVYPAASLDRKSTRLNSSHEW